MALPLPISPRHHFHYILSSSTSARHIRSCSGEKKSACTGMGMRDVMVVACTFHRNFPIFNIASLNPVYECHVLIAYFALPANTIDTAFHTICSPSDFASSPTRRKMRREKKSKRETSYLLPFAYMIHHVGISVSLSLSLSYVMYRALCAPSTNAHP